MTKCVEWTTDVEGLPLWRHECRCPHDRIHGIQVFIDPSLPEEYRTAVFERARSRAHGARCEDDHPELLEAQRG